ncbi:MAG: CGNR zinc finger domain-containing protein [Candidatus Eremiobacteraeota bacterium]|nr:CGNR zinc finger domain-containing protein [Candidatus Eremiobacteraeota bacterium]
MAAKTESKPPVTPPPKREPAPGELAVVQEFINSMDFQDADQLSGTDALGRWLAAHKLLKEKSSPTEADLRHAIEVREALRELLAANDGDRVPKDAVETLSRAARSAQLVLQFASNGCAELAPAASGVDGALGEIIAIAFRAMVDGSWRRLKACRDGTCRWAFYDRSKNRSGNWCLMSVCGNRSKARKYRQHVHARAI